MKEQDKAYSNWNRDFQAVTFDLEAVLYTPYTDVSLLFYKRKLAVYNFTVYEQDTKEGYCYIWPETEGKRGSKGICSSTLRFSLQQPRVSAPSVTHVEAKIEIYTQPVPCCMLSRPPTSMSLILNSWKAATAVWRLIWCTMQLRVLENIKRYTMSVSNPTPISSHWSSNHLGECLRFFTSSSHYSKVKTDPRGFFVMATVIGLLPISKKNDLMSLLTSGAIPQEYELFYSSLPAGEVMEDLWRMFEEETGNLKLPVFWHRPYSGQLSYFGNSGSCW